MPNVTPAASGVGVSVPVAAVGPPAGLSAADLAFDDVFRQLTGGLLATAAQAGEALPPSASDTVLEGEIGEADATLAALPFAVVTVPVMVTLPEVVTPAPSMPDGNGGGAAAAEMPGIGRGLTADGAGAVKTAVPSATAFVPPVASGPTGRAATGADTTPVAALPEAVSFEVEQVSVDGAPALAAVEDSVVLAGLTLPAESASTAAPSVHDEAHVRGRDRRGGMRETPARVRTFDTAVADAAGGASQPNASATAGAVPPSTAEAPGAGAVAAPAAGEGGPREMPATAERAFALQRALARQQESTHRDTAAPGLVAQVAAAGAATGGGADTGADGAPSGRKHGRAWTAGAAGAVLPAPAASVAQAAVVAGLGQAPPAESAASDPAAKAAWRAAFASSELVQAAGAAVESTRGVAASGLMGVLPPAVDLAAFRERAPLEVAAPSAMPELDAATGEAVHTQIVKSIRMQWTGGLGEARVTLKPEYLGEVTASIKVEQGLVTATLQADTPEVRRWMEAHTATLRDALVDHGLKLDRLTVGEPERQAAQGDRQSKPRQQPEQQAPRQRARREVSETDTPFEVTTD